MQKRLDNLGRIVIPKEIRNELNLKINDFVDMECLNNTIVIKKINLKNKFNSIINRVLEPIFKSYGYEITLTNKDKVLYSTNKKLLDLNVEKILGNYFELIPEVYDELYLNDLNGKVYLIPVLEDGYKIGAVILKGNNDIEKRDLLFIYNLIND